MRARIVVLFAALVAILVFQASSPQQSQAGAPTAVSISIDCNATLAGVQSNCMVSNLAATRDVRVVVTNNDASGIVIASFAFRTQNPDVTRLFAPEINGPCCYLNDNPDAAPALDAPGWACGPGALYGDDPATVEPGQDSVLSCFNGAASGIAVAAGSTAHIATVRYNVVTGADPGPVNLTLTDGGVYNETFVELGTCSPVLIVSMDCNPATITMYCPIDLADVNNDNYVNIADVAITAVNSGVLPAPAHLDQNFDGVINVADRGIVASYRSKRPSTDCP